MSRIGQKPILLPPGVTMNVVGQTLTVRGHKGELTRLLPSFFTVRVAAGEAVVAPETPEAAEQHRAQWGLLRALIANMVVGVSEGFAKRLTIEGVGYRAEVQGGDLVLALGFSHPVRMSAPAGIVFGVAKSVITVSGIDKELVGQVAASIRAFKKPEPYKGKGILYEGEVVRRKAGKKAAASAQ
ncbi:50S ribosomal protein L6 [Candidatus Parcubacteria bacterium]|nr:50S ribosomal protein L6 [Candidatus Parcubacteria bacterium]MBI4098968.1 50S ribosomal protein L6 [Candidatus Parcubacteria bacterium]MBI4385329.1 50S ribosomal protein L6 [Candidatus Parcubacteria bacterium]